MAIKSKKEGSKYIKISKRSPKAIDEQRIGQMGPLRPLNELEPWNLPKGGAASPLL
tara:strand:- start:6 stop:173 length:168 start_codon:yes stop_codon:yes gene_type:complete